MKKTALFVVLLVTLGTLFFACKKSTQSSTMSATINGHSFTANTVTVTVYSGYKIAKGIKSSNNESVTLIIPDDTSSSIYGSGIYSPNGTSRDSSNNYTEISLGTNSSNARSGNFEFDTQQGDSIRNGTYSIHW